MTRSLPVGWAPLGFSGERDFELVLDRRVVLGFAAAADAEAAHGQLGLRGVQAQERLEHRRVVPVERLGDELVEPARGGQRLDELARTPGPGRELRWRPRA